MALSIKQKNGKRLEEATLAPKHRVLHQLAQQLSEAGIYAVVCIGGSEIKINSEATVTLFSERAFDIVNNRMLHLL